MTGMWIRGLIARRSGRLLATAAGIAVAVALLASLGSFLAVSKATMTTRAASGVSVDWQVQQIPTATTSQVLDATLQQPGITLAAPVYYAAVPGLSATIAGSTQVTSAAVVLGLPPRYATLFPGEIRPLAGGTAGVLLAQQTAANLGVRTGDLFSIRRAGLAPVTVRVDGIVDLPLADSLFQKVGAPPQSQPVAPPDNVVLLPLAAYQTLISPMIRLRPDLQVIQIHAAHTHALPTDPAVAYTLVVSQAHHLEATLSGAVTVGNNLAAALDGARKDALYAQVLFLFLGLPGAVLAGVLTAALAGAGAQRRRREQALLRTRGVPSRTLVRFAIVEALIVATVGGLLGLGIASLVGTLAFGSASFGAATGASLTWGAVAFIVGLLIAVLTVVVPVARDNRDITVNRARQRISDAHAPWWMRSGLDLGLLALSLVIFWISSRNGYTLVIAPEGVATISVSYWAFIGPAALWVGAGLVIWRLSYMGLGRGRRAVASIVRPLAGDLASTAAAGMMRQRQLLARAIVLIALSLAFAASTATFNATYRQQAEVDARLTNGADVLVSATPGNRLSVQAAVQMRRVPGVSSVEPLLHRYAYIGTDLQDLYGVSPRTVTAATSLQNAYFAGGTSQQLMARLASHPNSILVSQETVKDYQLRLGDQIHLRLLDGRTQQTASVVFRYAGIVKEFPTAPRDSFFVANAAYVAQATHNPSVGLILVNAPTANLESVAAQARTLFGSGATVTTIHHSRLTVGSSLTSVDLAGLTKVELGFALVLAAASGGLLLALGLAERRRTLAIAALLGANSRQRRGIVFSEAAVVTGGALLAAVVLGWALSRMLVSVLTGVFDPPPAQLSVPWGYLVVTVSIVIGAIAVAANAAVRASATKPIATLREL